LQNSTNKWRKLKMADKVIPCRKAFTETILREAKKNPGIFVVTSDARGSVTLDDFANSLPEQFVEVGIAEQNAVGVGAGLALAEVKTYLFADRPVFIQPEVWNR
jgi:transketolase